MRDYTDIADSLENCSCQKTNHSIFSEAEYAIRQLMREREALLRIIEGDCEHCAKQYECEHFKSFEFPQSGECEWEWNEDY